MTERALKALASAIFLARRQVNTADLTDDDQKIRVSGLYDDWTLGKYAVGDIRNTGGQTWECFQAHDNATYPDITPDSAAWFTFWRPLHGKTPETARPFVPVQGSHDTVSYTHLDVYKRQRQSWSERRSRRVWALALSRHIRA